MATTAELRAVLLAGRTLVRRERVRLLDVPGTDGQPVEIEVRGLTTGRAFAIQDAARDEDGRIDNAKFYPALLIETAYRPGTDERLFGEGDRDAILDLPAEIMEPLATVAAELSGLGSIGHQAIEKNSGGATTSGSTGVAPSSSPNASA